MIFERRVVQQLLTGVFFFGRVVVRLQRHERQHRWTCSQEQNVKVIKVILQEQCQRMLFSFDSVWRGCGLHAKSVCCPTVHLHTRVLAYFESVWEGSCGLHAKSVCCPTAHFPDARFDSEFKRWNLEHVVLDLFSHFIG